MTELNKSQSERINQLTEQNKKYEQEIERQRTELCNALKEKLCVNEKGKYVLRVIVPLQIEACSNGLRRLLVHAFCIEF